MLKTTQHILTDFFNEFVSARNVNRLKDILSRYNHQISREVKREALCKTASEGQLEVMTVLIENCHDLSAGDKGEALCHAAKRGRPQWFDVALCDTGERRCLEVINYLLARCLDISPEDKGNALWEGTRKGHQRVVQCLLEKCPEISPMKKYKTFCYAAGQDYPRIVELLLADPDVQAQITADNNRPLRAAVEGMRVKNILKLLEHYKVVKHEEDKNWPIREVLNRPDLPGKIIWEPLNEEIETQYIKRSEEKISAAFDKAKENLKVQSNILDLLNILTNKPLNALMEEEVTMFNQHPGMRALGVEICAKEDWKNFEHKLLEWGNLTFQKTHPDISNQMSRFLDQQGERLQPTEHCSLVKRLAFR